MNKIVQHIWNEIRAENTEKLTPVFDTINPIRSTADMQTWYTSKPCEWANHCHINFCVFDKTWEATESYILDKHPNVKSFVKNDHIGFAIFYNYKGVIHKYYPDFIIKLKDERNLILETKGKNDDQDKAKWAYLDEWVKAVNQYGAFGKWKWNVSFHPSDLAGILDLG